jgi:hypothetical protein
MLVQGHGYNGKFKSFLWQRIQCGVWTSALSQSSWVGQRAMGQSHLIMLFFLLVVFIGNW